MSIENVLSTLKCAEIGMVKESLLQKGFQFEEYYSQDASICEKQLKIAKITTEEMEDFFIENSAKIGFFFEKTSLFYSPDISTSIYSSGSIYSSVVEAIVLGRSDFETHQKITLCNKRNQTKIYHIYKEIFQLH